MEVKQETVDFQEGPVKMKQEETVCTVPTTFVKIETNDSDYERISTLVPLIGIKTEPISNNEYNLLHYIPTKIEDIEEVKPDEYFVKTSDLVNIKEEIEDETELKIESEFISEECDLPTIKSENDYIDQPCCSEEFHVKLRKSSVEGVNEKKRKYPCPVCKKNVNMPKTPAERVRECRARKKLLKQQKPPAKTSAQRSREFRARKKALRNAAATIGENETSSTSSSGSPDVHQANSSQWALNPTLTKTTKTRKSCAQRCREYRQRKKAMEDFNTIVVQRPAINDLSKVSDIQVDPVQVLESGTPTRTRKSCAQRCREYRQRKKAMKDANAFVIQRHFINVSSNVSDIQVDPVQALQFETMEIECDFPATSVVR